MNLTHAHSLSTSHPNITQTVRLIHVIQPGTRRPGCLVCCNAPDSNPCLSRCCCVDYPVYILNKMNSSRYIYVRENSLEFNNPSMQATKGRCCGASCCELSVKDNVTVLYFDDEHFDEGKSVMIVHCSLWSVSYWCFSYTLLQEIAEE